MSEAFDRFRIQYEATGRAALEGYDKELHFDGLTATERPLVRSMLIEKIKHKDVPAVRGLGLLDGEEAVGILESTLAVEDGYQNFKSALLSELARVTKNQFYASALVKDLEVSGENSRANIYALMTRIPFTKTLFDCFKTWLFVETSLANKIYISDIILLKAGISQWDKTEAEYDRLSKALISTDMATKTNAIKEIEGIISFSAA